MRTLYLIRHGKTDTSEGGKCCIGRTDVPLGVEGHFQCMLLKEALKESSYRYTTVFCSSLLRSRQTGEYLAENPMTQTGLEEIDMGCWDGLPFSEIKKRWGDLYRDRGEDPSLQPPEAESLEHAVRRFSDALGWILSQSQGDIAVVVHKTVLQLFLCKVTACSFEKKESFSIPYGSVTRVGYQEGQTPKFQIQEVGRVFRPPLNDAICRQMLVEVHLPQSVQAHSHAVAKEAARLTRELSHAGYSLDENLIVCGALLHDIARVYPRHNETGAKWLEELGYPREASVIRNHKDLPTTVRLDEAALVYLADKCIQGDEKVTIEDRFQKSREKCGTLQGRAAHEKRLQTALELKRQINLICGKEIVL